MTAWPIRELKEQVNKRDDQGVEGDDQIRTKMFELNSANNICPPALAFR
jgi:hypothetical protein